MAYLLKKNQKTRLLGAYVDPAFYARVRKAARGSGTTVSKWLRDTVSGHLDSAARKEDKERKG